MWHAHSAASDALASSDLFVTQSGTISIAGQDLRTAPLAAMAELGVVFQQTTLDLDLTVRQNLRYFATLAGLVETA